MGIQPIPVSGRLALQRLQATDKGSSMKSPSSKDGEYPESATVAMTFGTNEAILSFDRVKADYRDMDQQHRVYFLSAFLRVIINCMRVSIGTEATMAILDTAKEYLTNG